MKAHTIRKIKRLEDELVSARLLCNELYQKVAYVERPTGGTVEEYEKLKALYWELANKCIMQGARIRQLEAELQILPPT